MRNYVKPESEMIALNMSENIAASGEEWRSFSSTTIIYSDATGAFVSTSEIDWSFFKTTTSGWTNLRVGSWLSLKLGDDALVDELMANCVRNLD